MIKSLLSTGLAFTLSMSAAACFHAPTAAEIQARAAAMSKPGSTSNDPKDKAVIDAVEKGDAAALKSALAAGGKWSARKNGNTALHLAASYGYPELAKILLDAGADPNVTQDGAAKFTPLMSAVSSGQIETVKLLLAAKANVNAADGIAQNQPIFFAVMGGCKVEMLKTLLGAGADPKAAMHLPNGLVGPQIIHMIASATKTGDEQIEVWANPQLRAAIPANAPFLTQKASDFSTRGECAAVILDAGVGADTEWNGAVPLTMAAARGRADVIRELIKRKVDVNAKHTPGSTHGLKNTHLAVASTNGSKNNSLTSGTPLMFAASEGHAEAAQVLLDAGADPNVLLQWEEYETSYDVSYGAQGSTTTITRKTTTTTHTAVSIAAAHGHKDLVDLLRSKGGLGPTEIKK